MTDDAATQVSSKDVAEHLQPVLVDLIALTLNAKQAHWHIQGRHFSPIHEQLDRLVDDSRRFSDDVAERVVALGAEVDGRPSAVAGAVVTPGLSGFAPGKDVVTTIVKQLDDVIATARKTLEPLDTVDLVTQDIIIEAVGELEKHRWMFAAQLTD